MGDNIDEIKSIIRSILIALGRRASEKEFCSEYYNMEGASFTNILRRYNQTFSQFMSAMRDVCKVWTMANETFVERVSTEDSRHMDRLTVVKKKRTVKKANLVRGFNPSNTSYRPQSYARSTFQPYGHRQPISRTTSRCSAPIPARLNPALLPPPAHLKNAPIVYRDGVRVMNPNTSNASARLDSASLPSPPLGTSNILNYSSVNRQDQKSFPKVSDRAALPITAIKPIELKVAPKKTIQPEHPKVERKITFNSSGLSIKFSSKPKSLASTSTLSNDNEKENIQQVQQSALQTRLAKAALKKPAAEPVLASKNDYNSKLDYEMHIRGPFKIPHPVVKEIKSRSTFSMTIVEISSPTQFVFQYNLEDLKALIIEMNFHYDYHGDELKFVTTPTSSMPAAIFDDGKWKRAGILSVSGNDVYVNFVDFGESKYVKKSDLRYLEKSFATTSRKSCRGKLTGIKPKQVNSLFNPEAKEKFSKLTKGVPLFATVKGFKDETYEISIFDHVKGISASDYLVTNGFAASDSTNAGSLNAILIENP